MTFEEASMPEYILSEVLRCGFSHPTPIQSQGWPMALKGRNTGEFFFELMKISFIDNQSLITPSLFLR
jgi:hypothetical protein